MFLYNILVFSHLILLRSRSKIIMTISLVILVFICGYRSIEVGTDTLNYYLNFLRYEAGAPLRGTEPLWYLVNKTVIYFGGDFDALKISASFLTIAPFYYGIQKKSHFPLFSIFIFLTFYYYFYGFNIIRQCIACSWCFLGVVHYDENKKFNLKAYIYILIAFGFHFTSVLVLGLLFGYKMLKGGKVNLFFIQVLTMLIGLAFNGLFIIIARRFMEDYSSLSATEGSVITSLINVIILNIAFIVVSNFIKEKDKWFYFFFFFIVLTNLMIRVPFGNRFIMYAGITLTVFLPNLLDNIKLEKKYHLIIFGLILIYCYSRFIRIVGSGEILPYVNTFFS